MRLPAGDLILTRPWFQFTHPRRVRHINPHVISPCRMFQFTHPRRVRRESNKVHSTVIKFQFTHPRRVRRGPGVSGYPSRPCFNSRTRVGCDAVRRLSVATIFCFNSRTRVGCDISDDEAARIEELFQFTHPRRVRLKRSPLYIPPFTGFNSRTRVGCDGQCVLGGRFCHSFQFTHPRRVRLVHTPE